MLAIPAGRVLAACRDQRFPTRSFELRSRNFKTKAPYRLWQWWVLERLLAFRQRRGRFHRRPKAGFSTHRFPLNCIPPSKWGSEMTNRLAKQSHSNRPVPVVTTSFPAPKTSADVASDRSREASSSSPRPESQTGVKVVPRIEHVRYRTMIGVGCVLLPHDC